MSIDKKTAPTIKVWARVGMTMNINREDFEANPEKAMELAIRTRNFQADGDTYIPYGVVQELIEEYGLKMEADEIGTEI